MACVSEAIGLALPGSAGSPAPYESRDQYAVASGEAVMELIEQQHPPARHRAPARRFENAARGGRRHRRLDQRRPAPAGHGARGGHRVHLRDVAEICARTPYIADLKPGGRYVAKDMGEAGGVPMLMKTLLEGGLLHGDCMTVTGKTLAENLEDVVFPTDQDVIRPVSNPLSPTGGVVGLRGTLAPDGAIVKVAGLKHLRFAGPRACSIARRRPSPRSRRATTRTATCWSSATRARRAAPACARCCPPPPRSTARAWAKRWR